MRRPSKLPRPTLRRLGSGPLELLRIGREMLAIPAQAWLAAAELAGAAVLAVWELIARVALAAYGVLLGALRWAQSRVRPAHGVIAVCVAAALALAASQLLDYRGVSVGQGAYSGVEGVAAAPEVARARTGDAHAWVGIPLAALALAVTAAAVSGRWRAARLLLPIGLLAVALSLGLDAPKGLDEGEVAVAYQGAEAVLLEGFWAQLAAGATLVCCGPLLAARLRPDGGRAAARRPARGARRPAGPAGPPVEAGGASP